MHLDLMFHVDALARSAMDHDVDAVHAGLCSVRNVLVEHIGRDFDGIARLSDAAADVVRTGQRRLVAQIDELIGEAEDESGRCNCLPGTLRLGVALRRQARVEMGLAKSAPRSVDFA